MIGPGIANPMLWGGSDPLDELGKIERSVRLRQAASGHLARTPGSAASDGKKWSWSLWLKRSALGYQQALFGADNGSGFSQVCYFESDDTIKFVTGSTVHRTSAAARRDTASHVHILVAADSTLAAENDRLSLWVDGVRQAWPTTTAVTQNSVFKIGAQAVLQGIGRATGSPTPMHPDCYFSSSAFVDGQALTPSAFGRINPRTGQWRPITKAAIRSAVAAGGGARNGWGANGFFLPFDDVSSLTALGYDRSQSDADVGGNNWAATNVSLTPGITYDSMLDTPTNNYATLNSIYNTGSPTSYSNGGLAASVSGNSVTVRSAQGGKSTFFFEGVCGSFAQSNVQSIQLGTKSLTASAGAYYANGTKDGVTAYGSAYTASDVIGCKCDPVAGTTEFFKNGVSQGVQLFTPGGEVLALFGLGGSGGSAAWNAVNFGQQPFIFPLNQGAATTICTKSLPVRQSVMRSDSAFAAVTESGSSVAISLAAKAPWSSWIRIYKRRDASEGWRWQFSDDQGFYLDSSATSAKAAMPALSGTSYVGYALKIAPANGITSGRFSHVNGIADVVVDGLATARKLVILKSEATGNWFVYHPDLTPGRLIYLNLGDSETIDATISAVNSSGFTVAATLPSGSYRWIALAETDGFIKLGSYITNGVADGPYMQTSLAPALSFFRIKQGGDYPVLDTTRSPTNPSNSVLYFNNALQDNSASPINVVDLISCGIKSRVASSGPEDINYTSGLGVIFVSIGQPFRYANAR